MNIKFDYPSKTRNDFLKDIVVPMVKRRNDLGITQEHLDYTLGVADRLVGKWECGTRTPLSFHLYCWADALNGRLAFIPNEYDIVKRNGVMRLVMVKPANDNVK